MTDWDDWDDKGRLGRLGWPGHLENGVYLRISCGYTLQII